MSHKEFFKLFLEDLHVASVMPSSRFLVRAIVEAIAWRSTTRILELGSGDGVITRALLDRLPSSGRLVAIERNTALVDTMRQTIRDPRCTIIEGSVLDLAEHARTVGCTEVDAIVSGVPFSFFSPRERQFLMQTMARLLRPRGQCLAYQVSPAVYLPMRRAFGAVRARLIPLNVPPLILYTAER